MPPSLLCRTQSHDHTPLRGRTQPHPPSPKLRTPAHTKPHVVPILHRRARTHAPPGGVRSRPHGHRLPDCAPHGPHWTGKSKPPGGSPHSTADRTAESGSHLLRGTKSGLQPRPRPLPRLLIPGLPRRPSRSRLQPRTATLAAADLRVPPARDFEIGENSRENHTLPKSSLGNVVRDASEVGKMAPGHRITWPERLRPVIEPRALEASQSPTPKEGHSDAFELGSSPDLQHFP